MSPTYSKLAMGNGAWLCVLGGSITTTWTDSAATKVIADIDADCTTGYESFWIIANVMKDGKPEGFNAASLAASPELQLKITDRSLSLWSKTAPGGNVTVSLDGVTLSLQSKPEVMTTPPALPSVCATNGCCGTQ